jgi:hypothetical protein
LTVPATITTPKYDSSVRPSAVNGFLFHRTAASHPRRPFPKLGITSRTGLSAALSTITSDGEGRAPMPVYSTECRESQGPARIEHDVCA